MIQHKTVALSETTLWYGAACIGFLDGTLSFIVLQKLHGALEPHNEGREITVSDVGANFTLIYFTFAPALTTA